MKKKKHLFLNVSLFCVLFFSAILTFEKNSDFQNKEKSIEATPLSTRQSSITSKTLEVKVTLGAIGDILIHDRVYNMVKTSNGFDFKPLFNEVKPYLLKPDILLANQETILGGEELGLSSYPMFNSPQEVGDALKDAGVDICSTANNHALDKGEKGLLTSIQYLNKIGLEHVGTFESSADEKQIRILNQNGIKIAYLAYTYGTNGIPVPKDKDYLIHLIDKNKMSNEIKLAKSRADIVVMSLHWGVEYQRFPNDEQKELAQFLVNEGVDIIFGSHPHVLQPMEWITTVDGRKGLVVYSLGNFLSGQKDDYKDIGGIATVEVKKTTKDGIASISLSNPAFFPTYVAKTADGVYKTVPLEKAEANGLINTKQIYNDILIHMTEDLKKGD
ncbi:CapA family protein [Bacillus sp. 03113]|uniref:CapA family protein n=1 Tax=Bacillus sp. 03113 TaxID=2578211 RepID=UPI001142A5BD|nr:CapA family protein [Bacillus sp. 03113]